MLSHTADARVALAADSLPELFRAGLESLAELETGIRPRPGAPLPLRRQVRLSSGDATALLVDFVSEVLTLSQLERAVFEEADFSLLDERSLEAEIAGRPVEGFTRDVKAVTYHEAEVRRDGAGRLATHLVFDL